MRNSDENWNNLFGEYAVDETAWYGDWTVYSPNQIVISSKQAIRGFRSNSGNTVITHMNRYVVADGNIEEKTWQIERATCNQPDGVVHPAMPFMRALSFGEGATAWIAPRFVPGKSFGVEFFFRNNNWRTSVAIVYGENGCLDRIVHIQEHLDYFSDKPLSLEASEISGNWIEKKRSMTADLSISPEEAIQLSFDQFSSHHKMISLPSNLILMLPERVNIDQPIQIAAAQRTAEHQLKYFVAHYAVTGAFTSLISASMQRNV
ncbi:DUF3598 family protein [Oculatella sp. FACHB-28]|uniref:DUF3598 family protein n=1 Tax=Oculatella sp. FACHB-28 TaxID=2692845 RepID=UPI00168A30C8|nr:DUF3598 family protein [Oculatella sp. FACHB-28]MBD2054487.1 DUF3598 family protein [Oculatella sp. FACHB-28]